MPSSASLVLVNGVLLVQVTRTLPSSAFCGPPATTIGFRDLGNIHTAEFTGLTSLAKRPVYYQFGDNASGTWSPEYSLSVPPLPGDLSVSTVLILVGDVGRGYDDDSNTWRQYGKPAFNTTKMILAREFNRPDGQDAQLVHIYGDLSYATGYAAVWDVFFDMITPLASRIPFATGVGNHESDFPDSASYYSVTDSGGECGVASVTLFPCPLPTTRRLTKTQRKQMLVAPLPANINTPWYSMDVGMVHLVVLSSEHDYEVGSVQNEWLEADLRAVNRSVTPWVIATLHRPMYIDSTYDLGVTSDLVVMYNLQKHVEPLFWKYRVNLAMYGHNHAVQRLSAAFAGMIAHE